MFGDNIYHLSHSLHFAITACWPLLFSLATCVWDPLNGNNESWFHELFCTDPRTKEKHGKRKQGQRQAKPKWERRTTIESHVSPPGPLCTGRATLAPGRREWRNFVGLTIHKQGPALWSCRGKEEKKKKKRTQTNQMSSLFVFFLIRAQAVAGSEVKSACYEQHSLRGEQNFHAKPFALLLPCWHSGCYGWTAGW